MVWNIVRRLNRRGYDPEDLFQVGVIGLIKAVDRFDFTYSTRFSTYAVPLIMGELHRFLRDDGMIKVSRSLKEQAARIFRVRDNLEQTLGRSPTVPELSEAVSLPPEDICAALAACNDVDSLSSGCTAEDDSAPLLDRLPAPGPGEDERVEALSLRSCLQDLDPQEQQIIRLRYFENRTQAEVGRVVGLSQVQISRLEKKILLKMRHTLSA